MSRGGLLDGIRVLDFSSVGPAARAARWLADYGAEVIKVGPVPHQGDVQITPPVHSYASHRGMRRVLLDLKDAEGRATFLRLASAADVVLESFRPGVVDRLGVGYDDVRAVNDSIVYCSTSGYGATGPRSGWAGHDLNYLAVGGYLDCTQARADGGPPIPGATIADAAAGGMHAVMSILAALVHQQRTGDGARLDVAVSEGVLSLMSLHADEYLATGEPPGPGHNVLTGRFACYDCYECADGRWLAVAAIEPRFWANLCRELGLEKWVEHQTDDEAQDRIRADLRGAFAHRPRDEWVAELGPADCCVAPVLSVPEALADDHVVARHAVVDAVHPTEGPLRQLSAVLAGPDREAAPRLPDWSRPDTEQVLTEAGMGTEEIARLVERGAIA